MKKTVLVLMIFTLITKILGFGRDIVLSYFYGVSYITDAYLISLIIPTAILAFITTGISTTYIPFYNKVEEDSGKKSGDYFTSNLINLLLVICSVLILLLLFFTKEIILVFASGFEGEVLDLAVKFTRLSALSIYFSVIISIFSAYLNLKKVFSIPALMGIPLNLIVMISIYISYKINLDILAYGLLIGVFSQMLLVLIYSYKMGFRYEITLDLKNDHIRKMLQLTLPVIVGVSVTQINVIVDRTMASQIIIGGISALNYAERMNVFVQGVFVMSIASVIYPALSKMVLSKNTAGFKETISNALSVILILIIPITIAIMSLSAPIIKLLFGRGAFDSEAIALTAGALFFYSIGMLGYAVREILARAFYAMQDTKTPMINAALAMLLNILLNIVLSQIMGINGLALATSISGIFCSFLLFINLKNKIGNFEIRNILWVFLKSLLSASIMGFIMFKSFYFFTNTFSEVVALIYSLIIGGIIYFTLIYLLRLKEITSLLNNGKSFLKKELIKKKEAKE